jgi:hypothetical protein
MERCFALGQASAGRSLLVTTVTELREVVRCLLSRLPRDAPLLFYRWVWLPRQVRSARDLHLTLRSDIREVH